METISIVIPVYNVELYLRRCLDSVCTQTFKNLEIICVNDGSTDTSALILEEYAKKDNRIKVIHQKNQGVSVARNVGMREVTGQYCAFLDSDDFIHPQFCEIMLQLLKNNHCDVAENRILKYKNFSEQIGLNKINNVKYKILKDPLWSMLSHQKFRTRFMVCPRLYRTEIIKNFNFIEGIYFEDYPWSVCLLSQNLKVVVTTDHLYYYTYNPNSTTKTKFTVKKCNDYFEGLKFVLKYFTENHKDVSFLRKRLVPTIFKTQLKMIEDIKDNKELLIVFAKQIKWAKEHNILSIWHNNWKRYFKYCQILHIVKKGEDNE